MRQRDYRLTGSSAKQALENGLAKAKWYQTSISRDEMASFTQRSDRQALRDTAVYYGAMVLLATAGVALWPSWWSAPFWIAYSTLYASGADSRWHECGHRTAFKTRWMNQLVYQIACFCLLRNPVVWRRSHIRHHADTIIVGRDPEIITMRPPDLMILIPLFFGWDTIKQFGNMCRHVATGVNEEEASFIPEREHNDVRRVAAIWLAIFIATLIIAISLQTVLPFMLLFGPVVLGSWHYLLTGLLQHTGLADNVIDHRLNTRTVLMNPVSRFIYWNMNYHIEHHLSLIHI